MTHGAKHYHLSTTKVQNHVKSNSHPIFVLKIMFPFRAQTLLIIPVKCKQYPLNTEAPCWILPRRHGHLSRKISSVVFRLSSVLKTDLFTLILCGVCLSSHEPSLSPLYSQRSTHPKEGLDIQLATVLAASVIQPLTGLQPTSRLSPKIVYPSFQSLSTNCQTIVTSNPLMWCDFL